jgi:hypothetical protein
MAEGQSARRLAYLYPTLTSNFRDAFLKDGRFDLISDGELSHALAKPGRAREKIDPHDAAQLREIGKRAGADLVFVSYYYEMGCHAGIRADNVLTLVAVHNESVETIDKTFGRELTDKELAASDAAILQELLKIAGTLVAARWGAWVERMAQSGWRVRRLDPLWQVCSALGGLQPRQDVFVVRKRQAGWWLHSGPETALPWEVTGTTRVIDSESILRAKHLEGKTQRPDPFVVEAYHVGSLQEPRKGASNPDWGNKKGLSGTHAIKEPPIASRTDL